MVLPVSSSVPLAIAVASLISLLGTATSGCMTLPGNSSPSLPQSAPPAAKQVSEEAPDDATYAQVTRVEVTPRESGSYTFAVTIASPDTGCEQYADWWEVLTPDGELIYRRILAHSHVDEQPFMRTGGPVAASPDTTVIVRAHMHPDGYGSQAMQGTVADGFTQVELDQAFAEDLADVSPQPNDCAF